MIANDYRVPVTPTSKESCLYRALEDGTGFSKGDILKKIDIINETNGTLMATYWYNTDTGLALTAAPTLGGATPDAEKLDNKRIQLGSEKLAVSNAAAGVGLAAIPPKANHAEVHVWLADISFTTDGTAPNTTDTGVRQGNGQYFELEGRDEITNFLAIRLGTVDASIWVEYFCEFDAND